MAKKPDLNKLLAKWQRRLRLQDWDITVRWVDKDEFANDTAVGQNLLSPKNKEAVIEILDPDEITNDFPRMKDVELTLIHELVHCIIHRKVFKGDPDGEAVIEHLAKAFRAL